MKTVVISLAAVALAALTAGCGYSERTYAVQGPAPSTERAVAVPGAEYYGDRPTTYYYPSSSTTYVRSY